MGAGERIVANPGHSIGNSNRGQATAMIERIIADRVYALRESYHFKSTATIVFAKCFISTICTLNGRKVMT